MPFSVRKQIPAFVFQWVYIKVKVMCAVLGEREKKKIAQQHSESKDLVTVQSGKTENRRSLLFYLSIPRKNY